AGVKPAKDRVEALKKKLADKDFKDLDERYLTKDAYAADAYRVLWPNTGPNCTQCHSIEGRGGKQAPALDRVHERLRPEWTAEWISHPARMFPYSPAMQVNFPKPLPGEEKDPVKNPTLAFAFDGTPREQIM